MEKRLKEKGEETRNRILKAGSICFSRKGYDATSVEEICKEAGISKGGFFHHFPTKQALFLELLNNWLSELDKEMDRITSVSENIYDSLIKMTGLIKKVLEDSYGQLPLFLEFWMKASKDKEIWEQTISHFKRYREYFSELIERGRREGSLKEGDSKLLSHIIVSFSVGLILQELLDPSGGDWGEIAKGGIQLVLKS